MFTKNNEHLQQPLFLYRNFLPRKLQRELEKTWAPVFYKELFCRVDEEIFSVLYAETYSRPNVPVNILVGLEILKNYLGVSDEELLNQYYFNILVRYALGIWDIDKYLLCLRTIYYFRERIAEHMLNTGENLFEKVFEQITPEQLKKFGIRTKKQRMDSAQICSNIKDYSRMQLIVEVIRRFYRKIEEADKEAKEAYEEKFKPYIEKSAGQYCYGLTKDNYEQRMKTAGEILSWIVKEMGEKYGAETVYQVVERVLKDQYKIEGKEITPKEGKEITSTALQSPDDLEATFRKKNQKGHKGYVFNVTETCDKENEIQLITDLAVAPNTKDDTEIFQERLPKIKERTNVEEMFTDAAYGNEKNDQLCKEKGITHIQTAVKGRRPDETKMHLEEFEFKENLVKCPNGLEVGVIERGKKHRAYFPLNECEKCPFKDRCLTKIKGEYRRLNFTLKKQLKAERKARVKELLRFGENPRAAIEAIIRVFKHKLPYGKIPVRGLIRVAMYLFARAMMINFKRIHTYRIRSMKEAIRVVKAEGC